MSNTDTPAAGILSRAILIGKASKSLAYLPFVPAGYPDLATTIATLVALERAGADVIEIGFPFSDPVADGPTIQEAFAFALARKVRVTDIFDAIRQARTFVKIPLVAMVSFSVVYRFGLESFLKQAKSVGITGLILPDLPPPEAAPTCERIGSAGLETVMLVAPTTAPERRAEIARLSTGFIYYLSVSGITGERVSLPEELTEGVKQLKSLTDRPVCVGFGVSKPEHLAQLTGLADGAIVGSALVKQMKERLPEGAQAIADAVEAYSVNLLAGLRRR